MAIILAVANQKGGCGKTTTVMNLAGGLTQAGYRALVVDADPQASATIWSVAKGQGSLPFDVATTRSPGIKGVFSNLLKIDYDIVLIDCPPGVTDTQDAAGRFARDAIRGADGILVPLRPSTLDFSAASTFVRFLAREKAPATLTAVLINATKNNSISKEAPAAAAALFAPIAGALVLKSTIGDRTAITEVSGSGTTIFTYRPNHPAALEYAALTKETITWLTHAPLSPPSPSPTPTSPSPLDATVASL